MKLFIYGVGGHSLVVEDIATKCGYDEFEYIDDFNENFKSFDDVSNLSDIPFFIAIGDNKIREKLFYKLKNSGFKVISLIDPSSIISKSVNLGEGILIMPNVVINAKSKIGNGVILNTSCVIEHENIIGDFVHVSPNVSLAGNISIGSNTHIGIGSTCIQNIIIGKNCQVGAGSVVVRDISDNSKGYGIPFKVVR